MSLAVARRTLAHGKPVRKALSWLIVLGNPLETRSLPMS
jgi:hypothetical protein